MIRLTTTQYLRLGTLRNERTYDILYKGKRHKVTTDDDSITDEEMCWYLISAIKQQHKAFNPKHLSSLEGSLIDCNINELAS